MTANLHPDHMRLLSLARASFKARDDRHLWRKNPARAAEEHGIACDLIWDELERQCAALDGVVPIAELPAAKQARMIAQMRSEIVAAVQDAVMGALDELGKGPLLDDEE